jgi:mycothiol synthase
MRDLHAHFVAQCPWVNWQQTQDGPAYGDLDAPVTGIAVGWQATQSALQEARDLGCNLFITREPLFYAPLWSEEDAQTAALDARKRAWLDAAGMAVYRCRESWDAYPGLGTRDAWAAFLGLGETLAAHGLQRVYAVPSTTVWELVFRMGMRVAELGEQAVRLAGRRTHMVQRLGLAAGDAADVRRLAALGADAVLATDDGIRHWRDAAWLQDQGLPLLLVNHQTATFPGLRSLTAHLQERFGLPTHLVGGRCGYEIWASELHSETHLRMRRDDLDDLPPTALPQGYVLRPMQADEVWAYLAVMNASNYAGEADQAWFERAFASDPEYDPAHLRIIWKGEQPVAAAAGWHEEIEGERWGVVHWVGVAHSERGRGLGRAIVLAALHHLHQRGFARATLVTQVWRLPAIATYLQLGLRPWPEGPLPQGQRSSPAVWDGVLADLAAWRGAGGSASPALSLPE